MPLYVQNGKLVQKAGALGTSAGCCCGEVITTTCCGSPPRVVPSQVSIEINIGALASVFPDPGSGWCHDDFKTYMNGTYVLDLVTAAGPIQYRWIGTDGRRIEMVWLCTPNGVGLTGIIEQQYCNLAACYQRSNWTFALKSATPASHVAPHFCKASSDGFGSYTISQANAADVYGYDKGLTTCSQGSLFDQARFEWSLTITPL